MMKWIKIENLKGILDQFRPVIYHPDDPRYKKLWLELFERCVNGIWFPQFEGMRYTPGIIGFMGVFFRFEDWKNKQRIITVPKIRDLEWHEFYYNMEAKGFSGFANDNEFTSDKAVFEASNKHHGLLPEDQWLHLFKENGKFKEYIEPREALFMLHDYDKGHPLYFNSAKNYSEMGSRGGGKSYRTGAEILYEICFYGLRYYEKGMKINSRATIEVTCGGNEKSTELLHKVEFAMDCLADPDYPELGVWRYSKDKVEPCPFWKKMTGNIGTNNKGNPWINLYDVKKGNKWVKEGNRDAVYNTQYAANSKASGQKSAGGRRTFVVHEEWGLNTELLSAWGSNEGMVTEGGHKQAPQKGIGTSGNMETVLPAKKIFTAPKEFSCLSFEYDNEEGEFGFFLPVYMVDNSMKDENGNTDIAKAIEKHGKIREEKAKAKNPEVYYEHIMNYPMYIEDMWVQGHGNRLPALEAEAREKELMKGNLYQEIGTPIELFWDNMSPNGINYRVHDEGVPFYEFPFEPNRTTRETVFTMFIHPSKLMVNGSIPNDAVFVVHDPYVSDEMNAGGSIGAAYFVVNPKYIPYGLPGNMIAASLLGKAPKGVDHYNQILELGMHFYGNPVHGLWYEANRGDKLRSYFLRKKKLGLLCMRPQFEQGQYMYLRNVTQTGYMVSGQSRIHLIDAFADWLLEETELTIDGQTETKLNIQRIPCIFLLRQIKQYQLKKGNFDAVDAMQGISLAVGEQRHRVETKSKKRNMGVYSSFIKNKVYGNARY